MLVCITQSAIEDLSDRLRWSAQEEEKIEFSEGEVKRKLDALRDRVYAAAEGFGLDKKVYKTVIISGEETDAGITADRRGKVIILSLTRNDLFCEKPVWHELGHIVDIMHEAFGFDVALQYNKRSEMRRVISEIWNVCLDARLNRREINTYSKEQRKEFFRKMFCKIDEHFKSDKEFEELWNKPDLTHSEIVKLADDWYVHTKVLAVCPTCDRPLEG